MGEKSFFLTVKNGRIRVLRFGDGPQLLLAFHGFSEEASVFEPFGKALEATYTILAIDLPLHGASEWAAPTFSAEDIQEIITQLLEKEGHNRFSMLGFSFGARLVQALAPTFSAQLDQLFLLSPDGIKTRGLGLAAKTPIWMRRLIAKALKNSSGPLALVRLGRKMGLVSPHNGQFVERHLGQTARKNRLLTYWISMGAFRFQLSDLQRFLAQSNFETVVVLGAEDPLLDTSRIADFYRQIPNVRVEVLPNQGHRISAEVFASFIKKTNQSSLSP